MRSRAILGILLIVLVTAFFLSPSASTVWPTIRSHLADWQAFSAQHRLLAALLFVFAYSLVTGLSLPVATAFSLLAGALFGRWWGTFLAVSAATVGSTLAFLASRHLLRDWVSQRFGTRLAAIETGFARDGAFYLLSLRLMPILPFFAINLVMGLTPIRTRVYAVITWVGMIPGAFVIVNAGRAAANIETLQGLVSAEMLLALTLLGVLPLGLRWAVGRWRHRW